MDAVTDHTQPFFHLRLPILPATSEPQYGLSLEEDNWPLGGKLTALLNPPSRKGQWFPLPG